MINKCLHILCKYKKVTIIYIRERTPQSVHLTAAFLCQNAKKDTAPTFCSLRIDKTERQGQQWQHIAVKCYTERAVDKRPKNW